MSIGIIAVDIGNIASVKNMLIQVGFKADLLSVPPNKEMFYRWIILPGVGAYDNGVNKLKNSGWFSWLQENQETYNKSSILGICLGMQLLCEGSEEGNLQGLGLIPGYFKKFVFNEIQDSNLKIPHMCWNGVKFDDDKILWAQKINFYDPRYYFVHSYHYTSNTNEYVIGCTEHGIQFGSAIKNNHVIGFQFHPEKSHKYGKLLLSEILKCKN